MGPSNLSRSWPENQTNDITCFEYGGTGPWNSGNLKRQGNKLSPGASRMKDTLTLAQWDSHQTSDLHAIRTSEPVDNFHKSSFKPNWQHMLRKKISKCFLPLIFYHLSSFYKLRIYFCVLCQVGNYLSFFFLIDNQLFWDIVLKNTTLFPNTGNATFDIYFGFSIGSTRLFLYPCALIHYLNYCTFLVSYCVESEPMPIKWTQWS